MTNNTNNQEGLALMEAFQFPSTSVQDSSFALEDLADDMEGLNISFQRVKIPAGGTLQFELPGDEPENPDYVKTLEGVILYTHATGAYWQEGSEYDENSTPLCASVDGKTGIGDPGGACAVCANNQFGTGKDGKGKACKNMRVMYLLRDGDCLPIQLTLPPTSIRPYSDFYSVAFASRRRATFGSVVQIGLKRADNGANIYSVATFKKLGDFTGEQLMQAKACSDSFREQIKILNLQRAADAGVRYEDSYEEGYSVDSAGESFCLTSGAIDGDREELPA